jgi:hypothetical protein
MSNKSEPKPADKSRVASIQAEIDRLTRGDKQPGDERKTPANPRDFINNWMVENDEKPKKK